MDLLVRELLLDMRREAMAARAVIADRTIEAVVEDEVLSRALAHSLMLIGEAANQVPETYRDLHPQIAWRQARRLRNRIVHGYKKVVPEILVETARDDLPILIAQIDALLEREPE